MIQEIRDTASVTLDANGFGAVQFSFNNAARTEINMVNVRATSAVLEAQCRMYRNVVDDSHLVAAGTFSGSSGDTASGDPPIRLFNGDRLIIVWAGGDVGAIATATIQGQATLVQRGFRAI